MLHRVWWVLLVVTLCPAFALAQKRLDQPSVETVVKEGLARWQAPGLAVAVVQSDDVLLLGQGVRQLGKADAVTPDTIFALASLTKAFTAAALGVLVDDGKADWDDTVRKHLDWFRLKDPLADRDVTLRDLLCHRSGLARHDILWYRAAWPIEETVRRMAHLDPSSSFRSRYEYCNLTYVAAGLAIAGAAGKPWHEFVQERLLTPLGMKNTVFSEAAARARSDHATPHRRGKHGKQAPINWYPDAKQLRASGSLKGSVRDLVPWMRLHLNEGQFEGKRILAAATLAEMHRPQVVAPLGATTRRLTEATQSSYGLGWHVRDYRGWSLLEHGGSNDGFRGRIVLVPKAKLGIALLTNAEEADLLDAVAYRLLDKALGLKEKDWFGLVPKRKTTVAAAAAERKSGTRPSREPSAYAGKYRDAAYGELVIEAKGKELTLAWSSFRGSLAHHHYDTFRMTAKDEANARVNGELATFALDADGNVERMRFLGRTFTRGE